MYHASLWKRIKQPDKRPTCRNGNVTIGSKVYVVNDHVQHSLGLVFEERINGTDDISSAR